VIGVNIAADGMAAKRLGCGQRRSRSHERVDNGLTG
jgi:hypothetical protein